jgi:acetyl esterase/lipase
MTLRALAGTLVAVCVSWTAAAQPASPQPPPGARVLHDLAYVTPGHERQTLDLYLPAAGTNSPVILWIHGGAFRMGDKRGVEALDYLRRGYAVASLGYRLSQHAIFPAQIEDCKAAVRWLRAHAREYGLDADHFGAWGASAGGYLVAMLGTTGDVKEFDVGGNLDQSSRVQCVVDFFGPTDFLQMDAHRLPGGMEHGIADSPESQLIGGKLSAHPDRVQRANPITYVSAGDPPFLIVHGDRDPLVPHHQSEVLEQALKQASVPVTFYTVAGAGHGGFKDPAVDRLVGEFFERYLRAPAPATNR